MPLLDYINHDPSPNVIARPHHDKVNDQSFIVIEAIKDIEPGEQMLMSYGNLPNSHLIQKYGFTLPDNPIKQSIVRLPWRDYNPLLFEEHSLKSEISKKLKIPLNPHILPCTLHTDKFDGAIMQQLRLTFLSS